MITTMNLEQRLRQAGTDPEEEREKRSHNSLWEGPSGKGPNGGVTYSLLNKYLACKERFRLHVVQGIRTTDHFSHRMEYGNFFHLAEETYLGCLKDPTTSRNWKQAVYSALEGYGQELSLRYPYEREQIEHWLSVCLTQFPIYVGWYNREEYIRVRSDTTPLLQEHKFNIPYTLPSGKGVRLRGKWDAVNLIGWGREAGVWLKENKTKGEIKEAQLRRQLTCDLQTMLYLIALHEQPSCDLPRTGYYRASSGREYPILGVEYNVIRRPLSGGKGTIVRRKASKNKQEESKTEYYERLGAYIKEDPETYFFRWPVPINLATIEKFKRECLDPILEQLCQWWECVSQCPNPYTCEHHVHHRTPYGIFSPLMEGNPTELDEFLASGSEIGLGRTDTLFPELK